MYDELVKRLRELQTITEHCGEQSCDECENRELCDKHDNKTLSGTYNETADAIETLSKQKWIPVTERLPKEETPVQVTYLGYNDKKPRTDMIACLYCGYWCYWDGAPCGYNKCKVEVTHWMPLQPAPKEENKCKSGNM